MDRYELLDFDQTSTLGELEDLGDVLSETKDTSLGDNLDGHSPPNSRYM